MSTRIRRLLTSGVMLCMLFVNASIWADPPSVVGRIDFLSGSVSFQPGSLDEWGPSSVNYPLTAGDQLWTDQGGRAEIHTGSTAIRLDSGTDFSFLTLDDQTEQIRLGSGSINVRLRSLDPGDAFEIDTPNSTITLLAAGSYRIDVQDEGQQSLITARSGRAEVQAGDATFDVSAGQMATVNGVDSVGYYVSGAPHPNEWDAWNSARDIREDSLAASRYVPREMIGIEDLDANGVWVTMSGYGTVWQPTRVAAGWAPYRDGRWAWVEPWGWTWIDEAPWGFAPFHYGRWAYANARWVWVPGEMVARPVYAPALVVFVGGDTWRPSSVEGIGWFPLAPREVYMPPYAVSTPYVQRVNGGNVTITVETIQRFDPARVVYANRANPQALTFVPRDAFTQSRLSSTSALPLSSADFTRAPLMGMGASLIPQRESVAARPLKPNETVARPPAPVSNRSVFSRIKPAAAPVPFSSRTGTLTPNNPQSGNSPNRASPSNGQLTQQQQDLQRQQAAQQQQDLQRQQDAQRQQTAQQQTAQQKAAQQQQDLQRQQGQQPGAKPQPAPQQQQDLQRQQDAQRQQTAQQQPAQQQTAQQQQDLQRQQGQQPGAKPQPAPQQQQDLQRQQDAQRQQTAQQQPAQQQTAQQQQDLQRQQGQQPGAKPQPAPQQVGQGQQGQQPGAKPQAAQQQTAQQQTADARAAIAQVQRDISAARANLDAARKVNGIRLDFNLYSKKLSDIDAALSAADKDAAAGRTAQALQSVQNARQMLGDVQQAIAAAVKAAQGP